MIGHELTAFHGLDHAQTLAIVLPNLLWVQRESKHEKLLQYAERVWDIREAARPSASSRPSSGPGPSSRAWAAPPISPTTAWASEHFEEIIARFELRRMFPMGEKKNVDAAKIREVLPFGLSLLAQRWDFP